MTEREMLELLLNKMNGLEASISEVKENIAKLDNRTSEIESEITEIKNAQVRTENTLETTIQRCINVMYEGYKLNAERLDRFDIESIKTNSEIAALMAKTALEKALKKIA